MSNERITYRILVIEDNPGDFILIEDILNEYIDPQIVHAETFREAESVLAGNDAPLFDVVLLDLTLPDKSGRQLIDQILTLVPHCPVIVLTGFADIEFSMETISLGIADYLLKDELSPMILYKSILYTIERKRYINAIEEQNKRLREIAFIQSHIVRAPLARLMGIANILKDTKMPSSESNTWILHFINCANELDSVIRDIIKKTDQTG
ncbi:response regulator [Pararcticibacter amylolyticus]|uniref:Response regulatory domain-containing protein n=1 Tax=Pararcticibacter amylolyticus TaxID=2173175 RepID=A0A2U2PL18_9SPHI|nr:response regulator [Pararcticibacter amylolyticus]PWG81962.1 hypothetical protein DDR33_02750 [Pararcticibacter amylolyticus]